MADELDDLLAEVDQALATDHVERHARSAASASYNGVVSATAYRGSGSAVASLALAARPTAAGDGASFVGGRPGVVSRPPPHQQQHQHQQHQQHKSSFGAELDALLSETDAVHAHDERHEPRGSAHAWSGAAGSQAASLPLKFGHAATSSRDGRVYSARCVPARIGGAGCELGTCSAFAIRTVCAHLRCTSCDFRVMRFIGCAWAKDVDYLFFRNCVPDRHKLATKLIAHEGSAAYCCQCTWTDVEGVLDIKLGSHLDRWTCSGSETPTPAC